MAREIIFLFSMTFLSISMAQQLSFDGNSDRWWFFFFPARNSSIFLPNLNPRECQPVVKRDDYTYTAGVGAHKVHLQPASWNVARRTCSEEGAHLAIVNSVAEANLIGSLLPQENPVYVHIGFHDFFEAGEYVTVHSQSLAKAGYTQWASGQPVASPGENCGGIDNTGKLHDMMCTDKCFFVCELPV